MAGVAAVGLTVAVSSPAAAGEAEPPTPDRDPVAGAIWGDAKADRTALDWYGKNDATKDPGSLYTITKAIGARDVWHERDAAGRAVTGRGVTVAVLDSGVSAVPGLDAPGKVVQGPDLSTEASGQPAADHDTYGHGTHMAGIIAAKDLVTAHARTGEPEADADQQLGVAPDAQLLALKLATADGSTDVSQVIAALDWVVQHRTDDGMNVRVVNLSFGTTSLQPYQLDPLAAAAENAWRQGLVVVVSGGNGGPTSAGLTNPAIDPYVIAVGASDPRGKASGWAKPTVADFSARGTTERHVDLLAPGRSVVSLRDPGSFVDVNSPEGRVAGDPSMRLFRGSGTSQAAAVTSGAVALLLQAYPELTPDQVKAALVSTATPLKRVDPIDGGSGQLAVDRAFDAVEKALTSQKALQQRAKKGTSTRTKKAGGRFSRLLAAEQRHPVATGRGPLDAARGGYHLVDPATGEELSGEVDVRGLPWDGDAWFERSSHARAWVGGEWNGAQWTGDRWADDGRADVGWTGRSWTRARWSLSSWDRARWSAYVWN